MRTAVVMIQLKKFIQNYNNIFEEVPKSKKKEFHSKLTAS